MAFSSAGEAWKGICEDDDGVSQQVEAMWNKGRKEVSG